MKITKNTGALAVGTVVALPGGEMLVIRSVHYEPDGVCYRVHYVEEDGEDYIVIGGERVVWDYELVGGAI